MGMYPNDPNQMNNMNGGNNPNQSWFEEFPDPNSAPQAMNFQQAPQPYANQAPANAGVPEIQDFASFQQEIDAQGFQPVQPAFGSPAQNTNYQPAAQPYANQAANYQPAPYQQPAQPQQYQAPQYQPAQSPQYQQFQQPAPYQQPAQPQQYQAPYQQPAQPQQYQAPQPQVPGYQAAPQQYQPQPQLQPTPPMQSQQYQAPQPQQYQPAPQNDYDDDDDYYEENDGQKKTDKKKLFYILFPTILAVIAALMALFLFVIMPKLKDDSDEKMTRRTKDTDYETTDPDETEDTDDTDDTGITDDTDVTSDTDTPPVITDTTPADPTETDPVVTRNTENNGVTTYNQLTSEQLYEIQELARSHLDAEIRHASDIELYSAQFLGCVITSKTMPEGDISSIVYPVYQVVVKEKSSGAYVEYFWHDGMSGIYDNGSMDIQGGGWSTSDFTHNGWTVRGSSKLDLAISSAENSGKSKGYTKSDSHIDESLKIALPENSAPADRDGFIFPNIDTEEIPADKIAALSTDDIRVAINDICALHGVKFSKAENQTRYKKYPWYKEEISMDEFNGNPGKYITNPIEKKNFDKLVAERQKRGGNGA